MDETRPGYVKRFMWLLFLVSFDANGVDFFLFQGPQHRATGGAGVVVSRSGAAVLHNPANLSFSKKREFYLDLGLSRIRLSITPPPEQAPPGAIDIPLAPLVSLGGSFHLGTPRLSIGMVLVPLGAKGVKTRNNGVPAKNLITNDFIVTDTVSEKTGYRLGVGISWIVQETFRLGFGLHYVTDGLTAVASNESFLSDQVVSYQQQHTEVLLGFFWRAITRFSLYGTYRPQVEPAYDLSVDAGQGANKTTGKNFKPNIYTLGTLLRLNKRVSIMIQYIREQWADGTEKGSTPLAAITGQYPTEYLNTNSFTIAGRLRLASNGALFGGFSIFPPNKGEGIATPDGETVMTGFSPDDFEGLYRRHMAIGFQWRQGNRRQTAYVNYITAHNAGRPGSPGEGDYRLRVYLVGVGGTIQ